VILSYKNARLTISNPSDVPLAARCKHAIISWIYQATRDVALQSLLRCCAVKKRI